MTYVENYMDACARAATEQGLDPPAAALRSAGYDVGVWQSGGFTMVLTIGGFVDGREIWVTAYDGTVEGGYTVGLYDEESLAESTEAIEYIDTNLGELPSVVRHLTTKEIP